MNWRYLKDDDYPKWYADIIVKCADGDVLKTAIHLMTMIKTITTNLLLSLFMMMMASTPIKDL